MNLYLGSTGGIQPPETREKTLPKRTTPIGELMTRHVGFKMTESDYGALLLHAKQFKNTDNLSQVCREIVLDRVENPVNLSESTLQICLALFELFRLHTKAQLEGEYKRVQDPSAFFDELVNAAMGSRRRASAAVIEQDSEHQQHERRSKEAMSA